MERGISGGIRSPMIFRRAIDDDRFSFFFFFLFYFSLKIEYPYELVRDSSRKSDQYTIRSTVFLRENTIILPLHPYLLFISRFPLAVKKR